MYMGFRNPPSAAASALPLVIVAIRDSKDYTRVRLIHSYSTAITAWDVLLRDTIGSILEIKNAKRHQFLPFLQKTIHAPCPSLIKGFSYIHNSVATRERRTEERVVLDCIGVTLLYGTVHVRCQNPEGPSTE